MKKTSWDTFVEKQTKHHTIAAQVSSSFTLKLDDNKKSLPTPYGLFGQWLENASTGDWTSKAVKGGFVLLVASTADAQTIEEKFKVNSTPIKTEASDKTYVIGYTDRSYVPLAIEQGYKHKQFKK